MNARENPPTEPAADLIEVVADSIEEMLDAEDGWMVGTPELRSMCRDFATAALTALAPHMKAIRDAALDEAAETMNGSGFNHIRYRILAMKDKP